MRCENSGARELFASIPLRRLVVAQVVSIFGDLLALFAVFSIVSFRLHGSPAEVSSVMISYMLPQVFVGPLAGVFVDRWNTKMTMIASDLVRGILVLMLAGALNIWQIHAVMIVLSVVSSFFTPAQTVAIRSHVVQERLMKTNAAIKQWAQATQIVSPGVAGFLTKSFGERSCFWIDSATFLFSAVLVSSVAIERQPVSRTEGAVNSLLSNLSDGIRFILTRSALAFSILSIAAGLFAIRCYSALAAVYVRDILHGSATLLGLLGTMVTIGMIGGARFVRRFGEVYRKERCIMTGLFGIAAGILLLAALSSAAAAAFGTLSVGFSAALVIVPAQVLMQGQTPVEMLGRVSSALMSLLAFAQVAALALAGSVAAETGIRNSYFATSALVAAIAVIGTVSRAVYRTQPDPLPAA